MSRSAKLPLALLAVLAMLFLMPGLARADDAATATGSSATSTATDTATDTAMSTDSSTPATSTETQQNAVVPNGVTDPLPCDPTHLTDCVDCTIEPFKSLPPCVTTPPSPPPPCTSLNDLPDCIPDCAFLAQVLDQDICTTLPQCLDPALLPPGFPTIPGVPVCEASSPSTTPPPSTSPSGVYYKNCDDARAHGASNIHEGQPGYRPALDSDHDGIACETSTSVGTPKTPAPQPTPTPVAAPAVDQLAYTGAVPAPVALAGFGLLLGGAGLLRLSRRPR